MKVDVVYLLCFILFLTSELLLVSCMLWFALVIMFLQIVNVVSR